jgi:phytoene dehydrogenase-like protein
MAQSYDVVVMGAGLGGLTAAALLAQVGRKVLLLERNASVGGAASTYKVKDLVVESALHQTGNPHDPRDPKHAVLSKLGLLDAVEWVPTNALYEVRGGPVGKPLLVPDSFEAARAALTERFPGDRDAIAGVLAAMAEGGSADATGAHAARSISDVFAQSLGTNEALKCALAANLACYHDDPRSLSWSFFAAMQGGCLASGTRFIKGGSQRLSNSFRRVIQRAGGESVFKRAVSEIRLDANGRPRSLVHTRDGADAVEVEVSAIASNVAPSIVASMLPEHAREKFLAPYEGRTLSTSVFSATLGLSHPPRDFGLRAYATVLLPSWMERLDDYPRGVELLPTIADGAPPAMTVIDYSAIDSGLGGPPYPVAISGLDRIANWSGLDRAAFEARRARVLDGIIAAVDREFPGFASAVVAKSLNTASSMSSYLNAPQGAVYGFAPSPNASHARDARTPIPGLFLASAYSGGGGFTGAISGGAAAAEGILAEA